MNNTPTRGPTRGSAPTTPRRPAIFPWWLLLIAILLAGMMIAGAVAAAVYTRPAPSLLATTTPIITVLPLPTASPLAASATPLIPATPLLPTDTPPALPTSTGGIFIGSLVQVVGTEGEGLRMRVGPGLGKDVKMLALESEVFRVDGGPEEAGGFRWWLLVDLQDSTRQGWAVENFLQVVQGN